MLVLILDPNMMDLNRYLAPVQCETNVASPAHEDEGVLKILEEKDDLPTYILI